LIPPSIDSTLGEVTMAKNLLGPLLVGAVTWSIAACRTTEQKESEVASADALQGIDEAQGMDMTQWSSRMTPYHAGPSEA
jgi:hypothetical protein